MDFENYNTCQVCPFFQEGVCKVYGGKRTADHVCMAANTRMSDEAAEKVLHYFQKWRRGADITAPSPKVVGQAIDAAIRNIRTTKNNK